MRKEGSAYDLTLAVGILASSNQIKAQEMERYVIMGELSLDGSLQPIKGALPIAIKAKKEGFKGFILPDENAKEAAIVQGLMVYGVKHIIDVINFFDINKEFESALLRLGKKRTHSQKLQDNCKLNVLRILVQIIIMLKCKLNTYGIFVFWMRFQSHF